MGKPWSAMAPAPSCVAKSRIQVRALSSLSCQPSRGKLVRAKVIKLYHLRVPDAEGE